VLGDTDAGTDESNATGAFAIGNLAPGDYTVEADLDTNEGLCGDGIGSFSPFPSSYCVFPTFPWHATAGLGPVSVVSGADTTVDVGAQEDDAAVVMGVAILEDDYAPAGTPIEALVEGTECGTTTVPELPADAYIGDHMFELHVLGEGEQAGCATAGAEVAFRVGGIPAEETYEFSAFSQHEGAQFDLIGLTAITAYAWYWAEGTVATLPPEKTVEALVDGTACGEAVTSSFAPLAVFPPPDTTSGFSKLIVPSDAVQSGCGTPGATVTFLVDSVEAGEVAWQPGLQRVDLAVPQAPTPSPAPEIELPQAGGRGTRSEAWIIRWPLVAIVGCAAVVLAVAVLAISRRGGRG
jgi:hypothetical protein